MEIVNRLTKEEEKLAFSGNAEDDSKNRCIGHLRCDFGKGKEFWTSWWPHSEELNTPEFKADLDDTINTMREWPLKDRRECSKYCEENLEKSFGDRGYGMRVNTKYYFYILRMNPRPGDYDVYCYCYLKNADAQCK